MRRNPRILIATAAAAVLMAVPLSPAVSSARPTAARPDSVVTDIKVVEHSTFDRLVIRLRKIHPDYHVGYRKTLHMDGSGKRVELKGRKNVLVTLDPARAHTLKGKSLLSSTGEVVDLPEIREWRLLGDFEGMVSIGLGVRAKTMLSVKTLSHPRRMYVDVPHS